MNRYRWLWRAGVILAAVWFVLALIVLTINLHAEPRQTNPPTEFSETRVGSTYVQPGTGKVLGGLIGKLRHTPTGACWIVYPGGPGSSVAPAPREVCGP